VAAGVPQPSKGPVFAIAAIVALAVLGGGAFAGYKLMSGSKTETTQAVITATPETPKAAAEPPRRAIDPPPAPPPPEAKAPDAKANETASSAVAPKVDLRAVAPIAKGRPPAPRPAVAPTPKPPAKQGTPDFGY
jgi:hypothetical protein